jgi:septum formation protein
LLALLGVSFEVCPPTFVEQPIPGLSPLEQVARFALGKARSVACLRPGEFVLGSDTVIESNGRLLGKPRDLGDARAMLMSLAGRAHAVHTAVALCGRVRDRDVVEVVTAIVHMKPDTGGAVERYLATSESLGKAGSYSIQGQGADLIEKIDGDYTAVVGLPLQVSARLLRSVDYPVAVDVEELYRRKPYPNWSRFTAD